MLDRLERSALQAHGFDSSSRLERMPLVFVTALGILLFLIRFSAPADLADEYHQERAAAYVMDALLNGNWLCQYGLYDEITSKPPMFTWLAALSSWAFGRASWFTLLLPGALATLVSSYLIFAAGRTYFGARAGFLAAFGYLLSPLGAKQIALVRIDSLFALTVMLTALAAFWAWRQERGWLWFWLAAAAATLTKGPLGIVLGASGLLAALWERRSGRPWPIADAHLLGVSMFVLITGGWFAAAYWKMGPPLIDVMLRSELLGHVVKEDRSGSGPLRGFFLPTLYFMRGFAPWCLISFVGLWRVWKHAAADEWERRFERFLCCWLLAGLLVFSLAAHQRPDLIFPLVPAGAWLAGRELARWLDKFPAAPLLPLATAVAVVGLAIAALKYHRLEAKNPRVVRTQAMQELAGIVREKVGDEFPLTHVDSPYAFQFYLETKRSLVSVKEAARLLHLDAAAFVAISDLASLQTELGADSPALHEVARWPLSGKPFLRIVSNHPRLEWTDRMGCVLKPLRLRMEDVHLLQARGHEIVFISAKDKGKLTLTHLGQGEAVHVRIGSSSRNIFEERRLNTGESWAVDIKGATTLLFTTLNEDGR